MSSPACLVFCFLPSYISCLATSSCLPSGFLLLCYSLLSSRCHLAPFSFPFSFLVYLSVFLIFAIVLTGSHFRNRLFILRSCLLFRFNVLVLLIAHFLFSFFFPLNYAFLSCFALLSIVCSFSSHRVFTGLGLPLPLLLLPSPFPHWFSSFQFLVLLPSSMFSSSLPTFLFYSPFRCLFPVYFLDSPFLLDFSTFLSPVFSFRFLFYTHFLFFFSSLLTLSFLLLVHIPFVFAFFLLC